MKNILIIDDEENIVFYLKTLLEDNGYNVFTALDPDEGLQLAVQEVPDIICLDIMMPRKSGITLYKEFKKNKKIGRIPVIIISGVENAYSFQEPKFRQLVPDKRIPEPLAFFEKPVDVNALLEVLSKTSNACAGGDEKAERK
jgi:two-component system alkaline phosphatase synthesis response regulator PhoP